MKIQDVFCDDPSGGCVIETWEARTPGNLALSITDSQNNAKYLTATLDPESCLALGMVLISHAQKNGCNFPKLQKEVLNMLSPESMKRFCICEQDNPCDYHAATCLICVGGCKGHPYQSYQSKKELEELTEKVIYEEFS